MKAAGFPGMVPFFGPGMGRLRRMMRQAKRHGPGRRHRHGPGGRRRFRQGVVVGAISLDQINVQARVILPSGKVASGVRVKNPDSNKGPDMGPEFV